MNCSPITYDWRIRFLSSSDMTRSKKIFVAFAIVFALLLMYVVYDISSRTTFPGRSRGVQEVENTSADTIPADSGKHSR